MAKDNDQWVEKPDGSVRSPALDRLGLGRLGPRGDDKDGKGK